MITLTENAQGVLLAVKARPGSKKNAILGVHDGALRIAVTAAPEKGKANEAIIKLLAEVLGLKRPNILLKRGATSTEKAFLVTGATPGELQQRLAGILEGSAPSRS